MTFSAPVRPVAMSVDPWWVTSSVTSGGSCRSEFSGTLASTSYGVPAPKIVPGGWARSEPTSGTPMVLGASVNLTHIMGTGATTRCLFTELRPAPAVPD